MSDDLDIYDEPPEPPAWEKPKLPDPSEEELAEAGFEELRRIQAERGNEPGDLGNLPKILLGDEPSEPHPPLNRAQRRAAKLVKASSLVTDPESLDQGDYEPGPEGDTLYKSFPILAREDWPDDHEALHGNQKRRFYVRSYGGVVGMVPWDGSQIVWPWEQAWVQDLYRPEVTSLLKEEKKKK